jgi:hypothetical protein
VERLQPLVIIGGRQINSYKRNRFGSRLFYLQPSEWSSAKLLLCFLLQHGLSFEIDSGPFVSARPD